METFRELIDRWATRIAFSEAVSSAELPVSPVLVSAWWQRDNIPPVYWPQVIAACEQAKIKGVTHDMLARLAVRRDVRRRAATATPAADVA